MSIVTAEPLLHTLSSFFSRSLHYQSPQRKRGVFLPSLTLRALMGDSIFEKSESYDTEIAGKSCQVAENTLPHGKAMNYREEAAAEAAVQLAQLKVQEVEDERRRAEVGLRLTIVRAPVPESMSPSAASARVYQSPQRPRGPSPRGRCGLW